MKFSKCLIAIAVAGVLPSVSQAVTYDNGSPTLTDSEYLEGVMIINGASVTVDAENIKGTKFVVTNHKNNVDDNVSWTQAQSKLVLGTDSTENISLTHNTTAMELATGLAVQGPGNANFAGSTAEVNAKNFEASGIHVGEKQPAIPANLRLDNFRDCLFVHRHATRTGSSARGIPTVGGADRGYAAKGA